MGEAMDPSADDRSRWWKGALTGALGLFFCYRGIVLYFDPEASPKARALSMGILLVLLAIQYFSGAPWNARRWLWWAFWLIPATDIALTSWEMASRSVGQFFFILAPLAVLALAFALWASVRHRRRGGTRLAEEGG